MAQPRVLHRRGRPQPWPPSPSPTHNERLGPGKDAGIGGIHLGGAAVGVPASGPGRGARLNGGDCQRAGSTSSGEPSSRAAAWSRPPTDVCSLPLPAGRLPGCPAGACRNSWSPMMMPARASAGGPCCQASYSPASSASQSAPNFSMISASISAPPWYQIRMRCLRWSPGSAAAQPSPNLAGGRRQARGWWG